MSSTASGVRERCASALLAMDDATPDVDSLRTLGDAELLALTSQHAEGARKWGTVGALIAGELAHRSRSELGSEGLARKTGHRTVEILLKNTTGATKSKVISTVAAGALLVESADEGAVDVATGEVRQLSKPWMRPVANAVATGKISVAASHSISRGLGMPNSAVSVQQLEAAATELVVQFIAGVDADRLLTTARELRAEMDLGGVKAREQELLDLRALSHMPLPEGGGVATWRMDPLSYARFVAYYDRATSPKRGGVRFIDPEKAEQAKKISDDPRSHQQIASDTFLNLLMAGAGVDDSELLGAGPAVIRITVAEKALQTGVGFARIDGQSAPISIETVTRLLQTSKTIRMPFDRLGNYPENEDDPAAGQRFYSGAQREVLAAKFGGCMDPDCERPPAWCEAHHIRSVKRDGGKTTIVNGILLCKYHHLHYHNRGYEILQDHLGRYWKIPPASIDPSQTPVLMLLKTRNLDDLWSAEERHAC